ncbi:unnamed protein product [Adineta steineri]|uniref:N-acetyltransferase domain-containing protein n=1 Tax=Adineta steineri TaxID=433720 RepID=A0A818TYY6_9BILA|nr:unnamed protein product [Adineta steineri]CAF3694005.1 unnamed protein product [Adineta steineri]
MADSDEYTYEIIDNESDARDCAQLLAEEFVLHNSIDIYHRMSIQQYYDILMWPMLKEVLNERLSFLSRHQSSGEIVGVILAGDMYLHQQKHPYEPNSPPQWIPLDDLLDEMAHEFICHDFNQELTSGILLHIALGATRVSHSGKGIATKLRKTLYNYARDIRNFQYAFVQVNSEATRHIYLNILQGKELTVVNPTAWLWKKKDNGLFYPYKDYKGELISNILIKLTK